MDTRASRTSVRAIAVLTLAVALGATSVALRACHGGQKLVEVFDNGPVGGPPGPSEGYMWVDSEALPPPGKTWKPTDPNSLDDGDRLRIR